MNSFVEYMQDYVSDKSTTRLLITGLVALIVIYVTQNWLNMMRVRSKYKQKGPIPLPLIGNWLSLMKSGMCDSTLNLVKNYGKTFVFFEGSSPSIYTADPEFFKTIAIKDFKYFANRRSMGFESIEPWKDMLLMASGEKWKNLRSIITTSFTSGKLKKMASNINKSCEKVTKHLDGLMAEDKPYDAQKLYAGFATDVICTNFFGVDLNIIDEPDQPLMKAIGKIVGEEINSWRIAILLIWPGLGEWLMNHNMLDVIDPKSIQYIEQLFEQIIEERKSKKEVRNDFIQTMLDLAENSDEADENQGKQENIKDGVNRQKKSMTNGEIMAQALLFMMAGSDTTGTALMHVSYLLAFNPEIQKKLFEEIESVLEKHNGEVTYDAVNEMEYMSKCISEAQRLFPVTMTDRVLTTDYEYDGMVLKKGSILNVLIHPMTHNEEIFTEPFKYDPDRERPADHFTPFGSGPRSCVAQRFALVEIKIMLTNLLSKYRILKCAETIDKIETDNSGLCKSKKPVLLKVEKR